ncbi:MULTISPECIES: hypothetical protein [unclassified Agrobacterium]|uniref:hypothetical protein n=1 Tax=unclassified Agrobacterium TaxID=2632611 RepID=UPI0006998A66|nr:MULTISPECIES: hypothetical protein [unclassified Agrobacterium]KNY32928.1 hypothetical protein AKG12_17680 [Agrobacterium sp. SUL3]MCD4661047.1 hypothetical protein [Agrobacterium sp.]
MRRAIFLFGMFFPFLAGAQDVFRPSVTGGGIAQFNDDCIYRIPPCGKDGGGVFPPPPPPPGGGGGIHNLPGGPVLKDSIIVPGNDVLKGLKLDGPDVRGLQLELQNR